MKQSFPKKEKEKKLHGMRKKTSKNKNMTKLTLF